MSTLASKLVRAECGARLERLEPAARARWGRMTVHQMICHLNDSFKVAAGEREASTAASVLPRKLVKWVALRTSLRWPQNVPTRPEIEQGRGGTPPADWDRDCRELHQLIRSFPLRREFAPHPIFGPMSWDEWQIWGYRHVDHHFRQFGV
jgi:hypothetical protein